MKNGTKQAIGLWGLAGPNRTNGIQLGWKKIPEDEVLAIIVSAIKHGAKSIDTSDFYGNGLGEKLLFQASQMMDLSDVQIFTKGGLLQKGKANIGKVPRNFNKHYIQEALHQSYKRLGDNQIDVYFLHGPPIDAIKDKSLTDFLVKQKTIGRIGRIGISLRRSGLQNEEYLEAVAAASHIDVLQLPINPLYPDLMNKIIDGLFSNKALFARSVFGHGLLLDKSFTSDNYGVDDHRRGLLQPDFLKKVIITATAVEKFAKECDLSGVDFLRGYAAFPTNVSTIIMGATKLSQVPMNWGVPIPSLERTNVRDLNEMLKEAYYDFDIPIS